MAVTHFFISMSSEQDGRESEGTEAASAEAERTASGEEEAKEAGRLQGGGCTQTEPQSVRRPVGRPHGQDFPQVSPAARARPTENLTACGVRDAGSILSSFNVVNQK